MKKIKQKKIKQQPVTTIDDNYKAKNMFIIIIVMVVLLVPLYFITSIVLNNKQTTNEKVDSSSENNTTVEIQKEKILVGQLLNRNETSYYVIAYKRDNKMNTLFDTYIKDYNKKEDHLQVYKIDLDDGLNKGYIGETTNITDELKSLKLSDTTLFKIEEGKIANYYVGNNDVVEVLKEINDKH